LQTFSIGHTNDVLNFPSTIRLLGCNCIPFQPILWCTCTENEIVQIATRLCDVLRHLHTNLVVHRDVKRDNILIDIPYITSLPSLLVNNSLLTVLIISYVGLHSQANVVLGDFGEALDFRDSGLDDFKLPYPINGPSKGGAGIALAPEILSAQPGRVSVLDYSMNDIYALGRVMWDDVLSI
jgi:serine/threonine protein kinase